MKRKIQDTCKHEDGIELGLPYSEMEATTTSMTGRYVDVPNEVAGYPGKYEEELAERQSDNEEAETAASIVNNNQK